MRVAEEKGDRARLQQLAYEAQMLQNQGQGLQEQMGMLGATVAQLNAAIESLKAMKEKADGKGTGFVPVGAGVFAPAKMECDALMVDVGAGVLVEKPYAEALKFLEERLKEAAGAQEKTQLGAVRAGQRLRAIDMEARALIEEMRGAGEE